MKKFILGCLIAFGSMSVYAKDIQTLVVTTNPPMSCQNCENKIKGNLRHEKGIKNIVTNIPEQRVTITYDADKTDPAKIEQGFEKIHYKVKVVECTQDNCEGEETAVGSCCREGNENSTPACCTQGNEACCTKK